MSRTLTAAVLLIALILAFLLGWLFKPTTTPGPAIQLPLAQTQPASCSTTFLGPEDFIGDWDEVKPPAISGGESTYDGAIALSNVDRTIVKNVLPPAWELATPKTSDPCHPILILFGHQTALKAFPPLFNFFASFGGAPADYTEMMVLVPYVHKTGRSKMHTFAVRMFGQPESPRHRQQVLRLRERTGLVL